MGLLVDCTMGSMNSVQALIDRGVRILDPHQTYVESDVDPTCVHADVTLYPGVRLSGSRTLLSAGVVLGREGPVVLINSALGSGTSVASGFLEDTVVLEDAAIGSNSHLRAGCLLEEQVKTAHCVGLKQTILMSFVTLGSLINFCDVLMAGGTSRKDHSEVGSGYIHFNFTPWGKHGGKATPSLVGDAASGVLLRRARVFLGGSGGMVGPRTVGYGSVAGAGQVLRHDVAEGRVAFRPGASIDREMSPLPLDRIVDLRHRNRRYIAQLQVLRLWYENVRVRRAGADLKPLLKLALRNIDFCISERFVHLNTLLEENGFEAQRVPETPKLPHIPALPFERGSQMSHVQWVQALSNEEAGEAGSWLAAAAHSYESAFDEAR